MKFDFNKVRDWLQSSASAGFQTVIEGFSLAGTGVGYVTQFVGSLRLFGSTSLAQADAKFDERHYFLVPDRLAVDGFSLYVTRLLPKGVPPINDLPKRRVLHLPNLDSRAMLQSIVVRQAKADAIETGSTDKRWGDHATDMADAIDKMDQKAFGGILLIGSLVAIFNPIAGATIAAKALVPSLGMWASTYGLRIVGEKLNQAELQRRAQQAESDVLKQFQGSDTIERVNPVLEILEIAVRTNESQYDPMLKFHELISATIDEDDRVRIALASQAVLNVYESTLENKNLTASAGLESEDLRFIQLLKTLAPPTESKIRET